MRTVNMLDAKTNLSRLVDAVERGEEDEVIIARDGKPAARLVPLEKKKVRLGLADGLFDVPKTLEEWNAMDEEIADLFINGPLFPDGTSCRSLRRPTTPARRSERFCSTPTSRSGRSHHRVRFRLMSGRSSPPRRRPSRSRP